MRKELINMIGNVNVPGASAADLANKVDKVIGKGLSTNDFTDAYKNIIDNLDNNGSSEEFHLDLIEKNIVPCMNLGQEWNPRKYYMPIASYNGNIDYYQPAYFGSHHNKYEHPNIIYALNKFWYVIHNRIYYSTDLKSWNYKFLPSTIIDNINFKYINDRFYLSYNNNNYNFHRNGSYYGINIVCYTSTNGIDWVKCTGLPNAYDSNGKSYINNDYDNPIYLNSGSLVGVENNYLYFNNKYYIFQKEKSNNTCKIYESSNGINFSLNNNLSVPSSINTTLYYYQTYNSTTSLGINTTLKFINVIGTMEDYVYIQMVENHGISIIYKSNNLQSWTKITGSNASTAIIGRTYDDGYTNYIYSFIENNKLIILEMYSYSKSNTYSGTLKIVTINSSNTFTRYSNTISGYFLNPSNNYKLSYLPILKIDSNNIKVGITKYEYSSGYETTPVILNINTSNNSLTYNYLPYITNKSNGSYCSIASLFYYDNKYLYTISMDTGTYIDIDSIYELGELNNITYSSSIYSSNIDIFNNINEIDKKSVTYKNYEIQVSAILSRTPTNYKLNTFKVESKNNEFTSFELPIDYEIMHVSSIILKDPLCVAVNDNNLIIIFEFNHTKNSNDSYNPTMVGCYAYICNFDIIGNSRLINYYYIKPIFLHEDYKNTTTYIVPEYVTGTIANDNVILISTSAGSLYRFKLSSLTVDVYYKISSIKNTTNLYKIGDKFIINIENNILLYSSDGKTWNNLIDINSNIDINQYDIKCDGEYLYLLDAWNTLYKFGLPQENE